MAKPDSKITLWCTVESNSCMTDNAIQKIKIAAQACEHHYQELVQHCQWLISP